MKILVVVDMQNDFITGSMGNKQTQRIVKHVAAKIEESIAFGDKIIVTRDIHNEDYLNTQEGRNLPTEHCILGTAGSEVHPSLYDLLVGSVEFTKNTFGSVELGKHVREMVELDGVTEIELVGILTDICVVSNALLLKAFVPEIPITVDASCCVGTSYRAHRHAITVMRSCQINVINATPDATAR